jgi:hypothetical protein
MTYPELSDEGLASWTESSAPPIEQIEEARPVCEGSEGKVDAGACARAVHAAMHSSYDATQYFAYFRRIFRGRYNIERQKMCIRMAGFNVPDDGSHISMTGDFEGASRRQEHDLFSLYADLALIKAHAPESGAGQGFRPLFCETGFNYGISATLFLSMHPSVRMHSFDLGEKPYTTTAVNCVQELFPGRFSIMIGDSMETMPQAIRTGLGPFAGDFCDFVFVDGGHQGEVPYWDIVHFAHLSKKGAMLMIDDLVMGDVHAGASKAKSQKYITEVTCDSMDKLCVSSFSKHAEELLAQDGA